MSISSDAARKIIDVFPWYVATAEDFCKKYESEFTAAQLEEIAIARSLVENKKRVSLTPLYHP